MKTQQYRLRVNGSNSLEMKTFENDWLCDLSQSTCKRQSLWSWNIDRERIVVFVGISLLLILQVQINILFAVTKNTETNKVKYAKIAMQYH